MTILYTLLMTHVTIACVTLYLHRSQAHRGVTFHPVIAHFMRFWLWITTGMVTKQWVAIHRKHHQYSDKEGDPHSPHVFGIWEVFTKGAILYHSASKDTKMIEQYGVGTPNDWIEKNVYSIHSRLGITLMLCINIMLFGYITGFVIWGIQMLWIPFWAAGVINGIAHWWGYKNGQTRDQSRNISPWGIIVGGEELHNNHHMDAANPKLSLKTWEFDIGWMYIKILEKLGLATVRK
ncbi:OLE1 Fatty-acid desaturase [uncultured Caudovirales phage]|uniref:OLE1 Fatty-acid desaturase n=1 Tax=uncultured Caudovirales phage TaxID=2100421 RepID=A0A6J5LGP3_9CAUD|nr:OLE1 Fatty-acid desaturase [uncultured Caudovirales phage]